MLDEARRLRQEGTDLVIGYFEPHGRHDTMALAEGLEQVPRRTIVYRDVSFEEMDTDAILQRRPRLCLVDEFAHSNVPGSPRAKRWEDVLALLAAGIDVYTTMNVQHLESLNDQIAAISGVRVRETVPDWMVRRADEVVMVDLTPRALLNRLERGVIYEPAQARRAAEHFFREPTLAALRELALRQTAHELERREDFTPVPAPGPESILIEVTAAPSTAMLIRRGRRVADFLNAACYAVYVQTAAEGPLAQAEAVARHLNFARNLQIQTSSLQGRDATASLLEFAHQHGVTQIFVARPHTGPRPLIRLLRLVRLATTMQVTIVAERATTRQA
jgi:two-component system sensor histidine kinase KdpD